MLVTPLAGPGSRCRFILHDALDALVVGISGRKVNFILDAEIRSFFDSVDQRWLIRFMEHRIGDKRILRLIQKWLKVGVMEDGIVTVSETGNRTGSGDLTAFGQYLSSLRLRSLG